MNVCHMSHVHSHSGPVYLTLSGEGLSFDPTIVAIATGDVISESSVVTVLSDTAAGNIYIYIFITNYY